MVTNLSPLTDSLALSNCDQPLELDFEIVSAAADQPSSSPTTIICIRPPIDLRFDPSFFRVVNTSMETKNEHNAPVAAMAVAWEKEGM